MRDRFVWCAMALCLAPPAWSAETCRYVGTASHAARMTVDTVASTVNGETMIDVTARIDARSLGIISLRYLHQEISLWRGGELRLAAVNHRYSLGGSIKRQQWDVFTRGPDGMLAYRAQAKTLGDFQARHPRFVRHWETASFGQPWLNEYAQAGAERRADLDLPGNAMPPGTGTPLAMAFHWVRWANPDGHAVPVFLPGFKHDARADLPVSLVAVEADGTRHVRLTARHPQLSTAEPSTGDAWIDAHRRLLRVAFDAHTRQGGARGMVDLERCAGNPATP